MQQRVIPTALLYAYAGCTVALLEAYAKPAAIPAGTPASGQPPEGGVYKGRMSGEPWSKPENRGPGSLDGGGAPAGFAGSGMRETPKRCAARAKGAESAQFMGKAAALAGVSQNPPRIRGGTKV